MCNQGLIIKQRSVNLICQQRLIILSVEKIITYNQLDPVDNDCINYDLITASNPASPGSENFTHFTPVF